MELEVFVGRTPVDTRAFLERAYQMKYRAPMPQVRVGAAGKPYFVPEEGSPRFNVSHSGDYVVCAFDASELGVDVQNLRRISDRVARRFLRTDSADAAARTLEWTKLESYWKMRGTGIPVENGGDYGAGRFLSSYALPGYILTVCLQSDGYEELKLVFLDG